MQFLILADNIPCPCRGPSAGTRFFSVWKLAGLSKRTTFATTMNREKEIYKVTLVGSAGNVALLTFKFIAGVMGHSSAMIADAVHSLSDFITDVVVLAFVHVSAKPQDKDHDYGHGKYETFASFIIGLALLAAATGIIVSGVAKVIDWAGGEQLAAPGWLALVAAISR